MQRVTHANFSISHHDKAASPSFDDFGLENRLDSLDKSPAAWISQPHDHEPLMMSRRVPTDIRKVEILCDQEPPGFLRGVPDNQIIPAGQSFLGHCIHVMSQLREDEMQSKREVFIQLDFHGRSGTL
jgi:hypothetical protein